MSNWQKNAICKGDARFVSINYEEIEQAKALCNGCPVQEPCIIWTTETDGLFVSAGTSRLDRLRLRWRRIEDVNESNFIGT